MKSHLVRILIGSVLLASTALLAPASAQVAAAGLRGTHVWRPSKLDYLVLASFADYPNMVAMSTYRLPQTAGALVERMPAASEGGSPPAD